MANLDSFNEFRKKHIGASDIAAVMGLSPWVDAFSLWRIKIGAVEADPANERMKRGISLEPEARNVFNEKTGLLMAPLDNLIYSEWPIASCSLDGINIQKDKIIEIKCPTGMQTLTEAQEGKIGGHYFAQCQWELMITKAKVCYFFVWHPEKGNATLEIYPNPDFQKLALECAKKFWEAVESDFSPDPLFKKEEIEKLLNSIPIVAQEKDKFIEIKSNTGNAEKWRDLELKKKPLEEEVEEIKAEQKKLEKALLNEGDGLNMIVNQLVKVTVIDPTTVTDWKAAEIGLNLTHEMLKAYEKQKKGYSRFTLIE